MKLTLGRTKYRLRVLYKSGNSHIFWAYEFTMNANAIRWKHCHDDNKPLHLNYEAVEAIYQVDYRKSIWSIFS